MALNTRIGPTAVAAALGLAALASAGSARALNCSDVKTTVLAGNAATHFIFGSGGSAITPTLARVAYILSKANPPIFVFYQDGGGAVAGYQSFTQGTGGTASRPFRYWLTETDVTGTSPTCTADATTGQAVDFATTGGTLDLFKDQNLELAADTGIFTGPTQGVNVIVPYASTEPSISAEALYYVFGLGEAADFTGVSNPIPWTTKAYIYRRSATAFVQQFLRGAIQTLGGNAGTFPPGFDAGTASSPDSNQGSVDNVIAAASAGHAQEAISFTSGPTADKNRGPGKVHTLAYQHTGQNDAYWPDSTPDAFDKINIRNGHYFLWDTNQFFTKLSSGSNVNPTLDQIANPDVKAFIGYFSGQLSYPDNAVTKGIIDTGSIPQCAMQVKRSSDFTGLSCYAPEDPCGCYFDSIATGTTSCDACTTDDQCSGSSKCHFGFCEAY